MFFIHYALRHPESFFNCFSHLKIVALLKFIRWVMGAWRKVKKETIGNCFSKCGFNKATLDLFRDDGADVEFVGLQSYISEISLTSTVDSYLNQDEVAVIWVNTEMKEKFKEKVTRWLIEDDAETEKQAEVELKSKAKQKNKLKSSCLNYFRWHQVILTY